MTDYEYIIQQVKKFHYSGWNDVELRKCVDITSANIGYHANIVAEKYLSRQLISYTSTIGTKVFDETYDVNDVIQEAESILFDIAHKNMKKDYTSVDPLIEEGSVDIS